MSFPHFLFSLKGTCFVVISHEVISVCFYFASPDQSRLHPFTFKPIHSVEAFYPNGLELNVIEDNALPKMLPAVESCVCFKIIHSKSLYPAIAISPKFGLFQIVRYIGLHFIRLTLVTYFISLEVSSPNHHYFAMVCGYYVLPEAGIDEMFSEWQLWIFSVMNDFKLFLFLKMIKKKR